MQPIQPGMPPQPPAGGAPPPVAGAQPVAGNPPVPGPQAPGAPGQMDVNNPLVKLIGRRLEQLDEETALRFMHSITPEQAQVLAMILPELEPLIMEAASFDLDQAMAMHGGGAPAAGAPPPPGAPPAPQGMAPSRLAGITAG